MKTNLTFKQMMLNEVEKHPTEYVSYLAEIAGFTGEDKDKASNFKRALKSEKKEFENFAALLKVVRELFGSDVVKMMVKYSYEVHPNKNTARNLLEYLSLNNELEAFKDLLDRMDEESTNDKSKEYAKIYRFKYNYELAYSEEEFDQIIKEINKVSVKCDELNVYKNFMMSFCFSLKKDYEMTKFLLKGLDEKIELLDNDYLKEMYMIRFNQIMAHQYLYVENNPSAARECTDKIISSNAEEHFKAYAYYIKGYSYLFESYENTIKYLNKSLDFYEKVNKTHEIEDLKEKIEFVNVYWDKLRAEKCNYIKNSLILDIKKGIDISGQLEEIKDMEIEFRLFFEGYNSKNNKQMTLSLIKFMKNNDVFLANLPRIELLKNGADVDIIEEIFA